MWPWHKSVVATVLCYTGVSWWLSYSSGCTWIFLVWIWPGVGFHSPHSLHRAGFNTNYPVVLMHTCTQHPSCSGGNRTSCRGGFCFQCHCTPPAPIKTVLMGGSEDTRSCTSEDDVTRCWGNSVSCEANGAGTPNMHGTDPDEGREWSEGETGMAEVLDKTHLCLHTTQLWFLNGIF